MYYRGKMFGFVHLYNGQEAVSTGVIKQLRKDDYVTRHDAATPGARARAPVL